MSLSLWYYGVPRAITITHITHRTVLGTSPQRRQRHSWPLHASSVGLRLLKSGLGLAISLHGELGQLRPAYNDPLWAFMLVLSGAHRLSKISIPATPCEKKERPCLIESELAWFTGRLIAAAAEDTENSGSF